MDKKKKFILSALGLVLGAVAGLWEYMQIFMYYDIPQAVFVLPVVGLIVSVFLGKFSWILLPSVAACSIVFQAITEGKNVMGPVLQTKAAMVLNILPMVLIFLCVGICAGLVLRVFTGKKAKTPVRIACLILAVVMTFGVGIFVFRNPIYPIMAHVKLNNYAKKYNQSNYPVSDVNTYFSYDDMDYQARVEMADGAIHVIYYNREDNSVYDIEK